MGKTTILMTAIVALIGGDRVSAQTSGCIMPTVLIAACKYPQSTTCKNAKSRKICQSVSTAGKVNSACLASSCVAPKGKTKDDWKAMSEIQRRDYILSMPGPSVKEFEQRLRSPAK